MKTVLATALILGVVAVIAGREFVEVRNRLSIERQDVENAWQQVDIAMEHRAELIPGLAESIASVAGRKDAVFERIGEASRDLARGRTPREKIAANERLSNALARLLLLSENYRQLRASKPFLRAQEEIAGAENNVAVERRKYNESLEHYNSSLQMFPDNIVGALAGFSRNDAYFQTDLGARSSKE